MPTYREALQSRKQKHIWSEFLSKDIDPSISLAKLEIPGLWIFGSQDGSVPTDLSVERLQILKDAGGKYEYVVYPELGHNNMQETFDTEKTALVVVDMQNYFMDEHQPAGCPVGTTIVDNVNHIADTVRRTRGIVIWIQNLAPNDTPTSWKTAHERYSTEKAEGYICGIELDGPSYHLAPGARDRDVGRQFILEAVGIQQAVDHIG